MARLGMSEGRELEEDSLTGMVGLDGVACVAVGGGQVQGPAGPSGTALKMLPEANVAKPHS